MHKKITMTEKELQEINKKLDSIKFMVKVMFYVMSVILGFVLSMVFN